MRPYNLAKRPILWLVLTTAIAMLTAGGVYVWRKPAPSPEKTKPRFDLPPLSASPFQNTSAEATYVGIAVCAECHANEHASYRRTAHSRALGDIDLAAEPSDASFFHAASGRTYTVYREKGQLRHREAARDGRGQEYVAADYPLRYLVGSGHHTRSYLIEEDGFLSESPMTWYAARRSWDMSPGYDRPNHRGFERATESTCMFCHVGQIASPDRAYQRLTFPEQPIGCERCHGPGSPHVAEQRALRGGAKSARAARQPTIVHPGKLTRPLVEAICAQCHLNSDSAVILRGRRLSDFRPGLPLSDFCINYRLDRADPRMKVVGHVDQMHLSRCYQGSQTLTCTTCHDPHASTRPDRQRAHYVGVCMNCHADENCRLERAERLRRNAANDCVACHMPQTATEIPHIAFTHHRIGVHSSDATPPATVRPAARLADLVPFDDVTHLSAIDRERNLGLAYYGLSQRQTDSAAVDVYQERARQLFHRVRARGLSDGEVAAALARLCRTDDPEAALKLAREALEDDRLAPKSRINALFLLADVGVRTNRLEAARPALEQLIALRRLSQDWLLLGICRRRGGDRAGALSALQRAVAIAPFRPDLRDALAEVHAERGNADAAQRERSIARRLTAQARPNR